MPAPQLSNVKSTDYKVTKPSYKRLKCINHQLSILFKKNSSALLHLETKKIITTNIHAIWHSPMSQQGLLSFLKVLNATTIPLFSLQFEQNKTAITQQILAHAKLPVNRNVTSRFIKNINKTLCNN